MKLTDAQLAHLTDAMTSTVYACAETEALVKHGLMTSGRSRFAHWASLTAKGREFMDSRMKRDRGSSALPRRSAPHRQQRGINSQMPDVSRASGSADRSLASPKASAADSYLVRPRKATKKRALHPAIAATPVPAAPPAVTAKGEPNAWRVRKGKSVMYYPVSMSASLKDEK